MKIKAIISSIIVCVLILLGGQVNAAIEASVSGEAPSVATLGEKIEYKLKVKADAVGAGIEGIIAQIEYPKEILTRVENDEIIVMDGMLLVTLDEPIEAGEERELVLEFIVNSNTTANEATIKFTEIILTDIDQTAKEDIGDIETKIQIQGENGGEGEEEERPTEKILSSLEITTKPNKTTYTEGQKFDKTGMKIIAKYSDGTSREITEYTYSPEGKLKVTDTKITISYTENELTETVEQKITVNKTTEGVSGEKDKEDKENKVDDSKSEKEYPKTGAVTIIIPMCIVIIIAVVSYIKYKKYKGI